MMNRLPIDIVTPTLDSELYLEETIISTRRLRDMGATHLICDSGSSDGTSCIIKKHTLSCVHYPAGNMYAALNFGFQQLNNEWLTYINSDDILYPASIMGSLEQLGNEADVIYGNVDYIDADGRYLFGWKSPRPDALFGLFAGGVPALPQPGTLFRRSIWEKLQGFDENYLYSADFDFFLRGCMKGLSYRRFAGPPVAAFRIHDRQFSCVVSDIMRSEGKKILATCQPRISPWMKLRSILGFKILNFESYLFRLARDRQMSCAYTQEKNDTQC